MKSNIGVLGLASKSTLFYIDELNRRYNEKQGGYSTCPFKLINTDFHEINKRLPHYNDELHAIVYQYLIQLASPGIENILIPNITLHETVDHIIIKENFKTSIVHPLEETVKKLKENNIDEVVLFGTTYTMNSDYIKSYFRKNDIQVVKPFVEDMERIDGIRKEVYNGNNLGKNTIILDQLIKHYTKEKNVVLACTELSMINTGRNKKTYDMSDIQINATLKSLSS